MFFDAMFFGNSTSMKDNSSDILMEQQFHQKLDVTPQECVKRYFTGLQSDKLFDKETAKYLEENTTNPEELLNHP